MDGKAQTNQMANDNGSAAQSRQTARSTTDGHSAQHPKPLLAVEQQIAHMKSKGITFDLCSEEDASEYLAQANNYLRTASYRKLFPRQVEGPHVGEYVNLDFEHLRALSRIDRRLREALLLATADVEHFAKMKVLRLSEEQGEDGYAIVMDFFASFGRDERRRMQGRLGRRGAEGEGHDMYTGDLIAHYGPVMPLWVLVEVLEFGPFLTLYKFCASRWGDESMLQEHYVLKSTKALRNACAHGACLVNGFCAGGPRADYRTNELIGSSLSERGIKNGKTRRAKLRNLRIAQIAAALYAVNALCPRESTRERNAARLDCVRDFYEQHRQLFRANDGIVSFFDFLWKLVDIWLPKRAQ